MQSIVNKNGESTIDIGEAVALSPIVYPETCLDLLLMLFSHTASETRNAFHPISGWCKDHIPQGPSTS